MNSFHRFVLLLVAFVFVAPSLAGHLLLCQSLFAADHQESETLGASDLISLRVSETHDALRLYAPPSVRWTGSFRVDEKGFLHLPQLHKALLARGLTTAELSIEIAMQLEVEHLFTRPIVAVTLSEHVSHAVTVYGAVRKPGVLNDDLGTLRVSSALSEAGGLLPQAGPKIMVKPPTGPTVTIDTRQLFNGRHPELDQVLVSGTTITVPERAFVYVVGDVPHPGPFPLLNGEETVLQLLALCGASIGWGSHSKVYLYRKDPATSESTEINVSVDRLRSGKGKNRQLVAGDILFVSTDGKANPGPNPTEMQGSQEPMLSPDFRIQPE